MPDPLIQSYSSSESEFHVFQVHADYDPKHKRRWWFSRWHIDRNEEILGPQLITEKKAKFLIKREKLDKKEIKPVPIPVDAHELPPKVGKPPVREAPTDAEVGDLLDLDKEVKP